jgi:hypothetical protein
LEDGRLSPTDGASFERHVESCAVCRLERDELRRIARIAARLSVEPHDALRHRRLRHELLRRSNQLTLTETGVAKMRWGLALSLVALACAGALLVLWTRPPAAEPGASSIDQAKFRVTASTGSRWHVANRGRTLRLALGPGEFAISVDKLGSGQRFVAELPDGELEVRGTRFVVVLDARETRRVSVEEGVVALRIRGAPERLLRANDAWPRAETAATATPGPPPNEAAPAPVLPRESASRAPRRAPLAPEPSPVRESERASAARDFATAMSAFSSGDYRTAERLFLAFEGAHPGNPRVEDTRFLRALSRLRRGDSAGARTLAREYLELHPNGFRAAEAAGMAR